MKNLKSKLFQELELNNANSEHIVGGRYSSPTSDTIITGGNGYDYMVGSQDNQTPDSVLNTTRYGNLDVPKP